jgi:hypothetical protein
MITKTKEKRTAVIIVRLTHSERNTIEQVAQAAGTTISDIVRTTTLNKLLTIKTHN